MGVTCCTAKHQDECLAIDQQRGGLSQAMARQAVMCAPVRAAAGPLSPLAIICALAPAGVAQLVEQRIRNAKVDSSSPSIGTNEIKGPPVSGPFAFGPHGLQMGCM